MLPPTCKRHDSKIHTQTPTLLSIITISSIPLELLVLSLCMPLEPYILTSGVPFLGMALNAACGLQKVCRKFKPHLLMVFAQLGYTFLYFITEASFNHGMNPHVYVTYRHFVSGLATLPFAYVLERNTRPKLTLRLLMEIFVLSILGVSLTLNMYFASLNYTSPTFLASVVNTIASLTFVIAVMVRLERLDLRSPHGIAKVIGTLVSLAGVTAMALYKGPVVKNLWGALIHLNEKAKIHEDWLKGSILTIASCITWSIWYIMQAFTLKKYPAQLSLTTWMSFVGGAQSAVFSALVAHEPKEWIVGFNIDLWSILYSGVVCSGLIIFIQLWCTEEKGPVFVTMFNPLGTLFVAFLAYFVFGERLYTGSILGGAIVIVGLYLVLWGKEGDNASPIKSKEPSSVDSQELKEETEDATKYYGGSGDGKKSLDI